MGDGVPAMRSRNTRQLDAIEDALRTATRPLTIAEIQAHAALKVEGLGTATVYRAVRELAEAHKILGVTYAGQPTRYEWAVLNHHAHFICQECRKVFDVDAPSDVPLPETQPPGFTFTGDEVTYYGICAECGKG
jgi:Fur family ferric uptake transcriptional regulator